MILPVIKNKAKKNLGKIGIGVDSNRIEIMNKVKKIVEEKNYAKVEFIEDEKKLIRGLKDNIFDGIVRGQLPSSTFLKCLKKEFNIESCYRLALLETSRNHQFFFAPVGIDEALNFEQKKQFILRGIELLIRIGVPPKIGILSGGRIDDLGRDPIVDNTIRDAKKLIEWAVPKVYPHAKNYNILIEDAIKNESNLILAPTGMSGNLIYRTLIHLGSGKSHGAPYLNLPKPVIDTSRVAPEFEYISAICFASGLKKN